MQDSADILGPEGPFAKHFPGFTAREQQQALASQIEDMLNEHGVLVTEAGTGTGKTLAYLVPALLSGKKILVSTGTKNLQDQLYLKDLPSVLKTLELPAKTALLKGRANYLCIYRMDRKNTEGRFFSREQVKSFQKIRDWSHYTKTGDLAELSELPDDSPLRPMVTSTADNCLGGECKVYDKCHVVEARRKAQAADIVVINHHLFFADIALRGEGVGELLPAADAVIFDEAHQLPEVATQFFGVSITGRQLTELCHDVVAATEEEASDQLRDASKRTDALITKVNALHENLSKLPMRGAFKFLAQQNNIHTDIEAVDHALHQLMELLESMSSRGKELDHCLTRTDDLRDRLNQVTSQQANHVHWYDVRKRNFAFYMSPVSVAEPFSEHLDSFAKSWIFTSATLSVGGDFSFFTSRLGLSDAQTSRWQSPFNYADNALLYLPTDLPEPSAYTYLEKMLEKCLPVLEYSQGRAFILFTSHQALRKAAELLEERTSFPLLVQGTLSKRRLLEKFREEDNAVLLGTASFWEGVDVKGEALSCVIIDKLPFATPGDPLMTARLDHIRRQGGNPFNDYQVPQAVIALEQGVGRLIRDENDRGVVMICDPRVMTKGYGKTFLRSLPPMRLTREAQDVENFFQQEAAH